MGVDVISDAIFLKDQPFRVELANDDRKLRESYRLRYDVYCIERGYEPGYNGEESDDFDPYSKHAVLRTNDDGQVIATIRLIGPRFDDLKGSFPIQQLVAPNLLRGIPLAQAGEMSRMAISKQRRRADIDPAMLRMALWRAVVQMSHEWGLTHWFAVIEPSSIRLHARTSIVFEPLGPVVVHHGIRQPMVGDIQKVLSRLRAARPFIWHYLTNGGMWCDYLTQPSRDAITMAPSRMAASYRQTVSISDLTNGRPAAVA